jgi:hypothetical protein
VSEGRVAKRCFKERDWIGVGCTFCPSMWCTDCRRPDESGGEEKVEGSAWSDLGVVEKSNSAATGDGNTGRA